MFKLRTQTQTMNKQNCCDFYILTVPDFSLQESRSSLDYEIPLLQPSLLSAIITRAVAWK